MATSAVSPMVTNKAKNQVANSIIVDVWSDIMCPFCYLGDGLLAQALTQFPHRDVVEVRYHSFQLQPDLPQGETFNVYEYLSKTRGFPIAQAQAMNGHITQQGAALGLLYNFDNTLMTNTRSAHHLIHYAAQQGCQHEMVERLFRAYFTDGLHVGELEVLAGLAAEIGLDRAEALAALQSGEFDTAVEADIRQARQFGIQGVPFFVFNNKYAVSGAQPVEAFLQALDKAWGDKSSSRA